MSGRRLNPRSSWADACNEAAERSTSAAENQSSVSDSLGYPDRRTARRDEVDAFGDTLPSAAQHQGHAFNYAGLQTVEQDKFNFESEYSSSSLSSREESVEYYTDLEGEDHLELKARREEEMSSMDEWVEQDMAPCCRACIERRTHIFASILRNDVYMDYYSLKRAFGRSEQRILRNAVQHYGQPGLTWHKLNYWTDIVGYTNCTTGMHRTLAKEIYPEVAAPDPPTLVSEYAEMRMAKANQERIPIPPTPSSFLPRQYAATSSASTSAQTSQPATIQQATSSSAIEVERKRTRTRGRNKGKGKAMPNSAAGPSGTQTSTPGVTPTMAPPVVPVVPVDTPPVAPLPPLPKQHAVKKFAPSVPVPPTFVPSEAATKRVAPLLPVSTVSAAPAAAPGKKNIALPIVGPQQPTNKKTVTSASVPKAETPRSTIIPSAAPPKQDMRQVSALATLALKSSGVPKGVPKGVPRGVSGLRILNQKYKGSELVQKLMASWPYKFAKTPAQHAVCSAAGILRWMKIIVESNRVINPESPPKPANDLIALSLADFSTYNDPQAEREIVKVITDCACTLGENVFEVIESELMKATLWSRPQHLIFDEDMLAFHKGVIGWCKVPLDYNMKSSLVRIQDPFGLPAALEHTFRERYYPEHELRNVYAAAPPEFIRVLWKYSEEAEVVSDLKAQKIFDALQGFDISFQDVRRGVAGHDPVLGDNPPIDKSSFRLICIAKIIDSGEEAVAEHLYHCNGENTGPMPEDARNHDWSCRYSGLYYMVYHRSCEPRSMFNGVASKETRGSRRFNWDEEEKATIEWLSTNADSDVGWPPDSSYGIYNLRAVLEPAPSHPMDVGPVQPPITPSPSFLTSESSLAPSQGLIAGTKRLYDGQHESRSPPHNNGPFNPSGLTAHNAGDTTGEPSSNAQGNTNPMRTDRPKSRSQRPRARPKNKVANQLNSTRPNPPQSNPPRPYPPRPYPPRPSPPQSNSTRPNPPPQFNGWRRFKETRRGDRSYGSDRWPPRDRRGGRE